MASMALSTTIRYFSSLSINAVSAFFLSSFSASRSFICFLIESRIMEKPLARIPISSLLRMSIGWLSLPDAISEELCVSKVIGDTILILSSIITKIIRQMSIINIWLISETSVFCRRSSMKRGVITTMTFPKVRFSKTILCWSNIVFSIFVSFVTSLISPSILWKPKCNSFDRLSIT